MQYLNSILASIGDESSSTNTPPAARPPATARAALPARPNLTATNLETPSAQALKRKAEGELSSSVPAKVARSLTPGQNSAAPRPTAASTSGTSGYRGTARPEVSKPAVKSLQKNQTTSTPAKPPIKAELKTAPIVKTSTAPINKTVTAPAPQAKVPKKGSFQEILLRAKQNQQTIAPIGVIKHKQTEKLSKKERDRLAQEAAEKAKTSTVRDKKTGTGSRTGSSEPAARKPGEQPKEKRKAVDLGYTGTARPKSKSAEPQYKGTMGLARPGQMRKAPVVQKQAASRYADYSEEELDNEEDYESDLSDMEAGMFDVEEEEELALREAKKDDAREKALENELKRQKQERKTKLAALAAAARKKKTIY
jgi:protein SPT2